jgi:hypothetical protein
MKKLFKAIADFQQEVPAIYKGSASYSYKYANLSQILDVINPLLKKHNLGYTQLLDGSQLKTIIFEITSGESIEASADLDFHELQYETIEKYDRKNSKTYNVNILQGFDGMNKAQAKGSMITYFRRYALSSALGLITDSDNDAAGSPKDKAEKAAVKAKSERLTLKPKDENWDKVVAALNDGFKIEQVEAKYKISAQDKKILLSLVK